MKLGNYAYILLSILLVTSLMVPLLSLSLSLPTVSASPTPGVWENRAQYIGAINTPTAACYAENAGVKYVYAFEGKAAPDYVYRYDIAANTWTNMYNMAVAGSSGISVVWNRTDNIYWLSGGTAATFYAYTISTNTKTLKAAIPTYAAGNAGSTLAYDGGDNIYALLCRSGTSQSWICAYSMANNTWTKIDNTPEYMNGNLSRVGDYLYIASGYRFWRYNLVSPAGFENLAPLPAEVGNWGSGSGQEYGGTNLIYANKGGTSNWFLRFNILDKRWDIMENLPDTVGGYSGDRLAFDGTYMYQLRVQNDNQFWRYEVPKYFEKYCMPDLGQHCVNWCWCAAAANSIYWYSQHGYLQLIDDPADPTPNDNRYITDPLRFGLGDPTGYYRLLDEIASDCGHVFCEGIYDNEYFFGLQKFINDQGAPLIVHEIVDPMLVSPVPPPIENIVIYRPPTLVDYQRELENCQDVLLWLNYRYTYPETEDTDHVVTGVAFNDNNWILVSDPWTPGAPDHNNVFENKVYDKLQVLSTPEAPLLVRYAGIDNIKVSKMVYISPAAAPPVTYDVDVSISPSYQSGDNGATLIYTVTVINTGNVSDNYALENSDDLGWALSLDNVVLGPILAGENKTTTLRVTIPDNAVGCTSDNITVTATSQGDHMKKDNDSCIAHVSEFFEKVCMPDLGQHCENWCWTAAAANSIWWYANHGYPELIDNLADPASDNEWIDQWYPCPGCIGYRKLLAVIASYCLGLPPESTFCHPVNNLQYFYGLQAFIDAQGAPLYVHEILNPNKVGMPRPPDDGENVVYDNVTFDNYKRELKRCQDVLLQLDFKNMNYKEYTEEGLDHIVTGVSFFDGGAGNSWIEVSDPWTPQPWGPGPDHNNDNAHVNRYDNLAVVKNDPLTVRYTYWTPGGNASADVEVIKLIYISPETLWTGTVTVELENLYAVTIDLDGDFSDGENLVAKFYTYGGGKYQDQTVVCSENIPGHVTLLENISRPGNGAIQRIELVLVDSENNDLWTVKVFEASRTILMGRLSDIDLIWPFASMEKRTQLMGELSDIDLIWPFAPLTFVDP